MMELQHIPTSGSVVLVDTDPPPDGVYEIAVSQRQYISIFKGDGTNIQTIYFPTIGHIEGVAIQATADIDDDKHVELICSINSPYGRYRRGLYVFDAVDGKEKWHWLTGPRPENVIPYDLNGDGKMEIILGGVGSHNGNQVNGFSDYFSRIWCLDYKGKGLLNMLIGTEGAFCALADMDQDGRKKIVVWRGQSSFKGVNDALYILDPSDDAESAPVIDNKIEGDSLGRFGSAGITDLIPSSPGLEIVGHSGNQNRAYRVWDSSLNVKATNNTLSTETEVNLLVDLNGDQQSEILVNEGSLLHILSPTLAEIAQWDPDVGPISAIVPNDLDSDGMLELLVGGAKGIVALGFGGKPLKPTPPPTPTPTPTPILIAEPEEPDQILPDQPIMGVLSPNDLINDTNRVDSYTLKLKKGGAFTLTIGDLIPDFEPIVKIINSNNEIEFMLNSNELSQWLLSDLSAGEHKIIVSNANTLITQQSYSYRLTVSSIKTITDGMPISGTIERTDYQIYWPLTHIDIVEFRHADFYTISLTESRDVTIRVRDMNQSPFIFICRDDFTIEFQDIAKSMDSYLAPGYYWIIVTHIGETPPNGLIYTIQMDTAKNKIIEEPLQVYGEGVLTCAAVSSSGRYIVTGSESGWAILWDAKSGKVLRRFIGHKAPIKAVTVSED